MKRSKPCLPRKMKKVMWMLQMYSDGKVVNLYGYRYPRTKWIVRAEREYRRKWRELVIKREQLRELQAFASLMNDACKGQF